MTSSPTEPPAREPALRLPSHGLSLTQPWASLVAAGDKRVETRSWRTSWRGVVAIHAAGTYPPACRALEHDGPLAAIIAAARAGGRMPAPLPTGAFVAVARLTAVTSTETMHVRIAADTGWTAAQAAVELAAGDYRPGRWAWVLTGVERLGAPVPAAGARGVWELPPPQRAAIERQLRADAGLPPPGWEPIRIPTWDERQQGAGAGAGAAAGHRCHAARCETPVPPVLFMCRRHWAMLPRNHQDAIKRTYRPGQEVDKQPSPAYVQAARAAVAWLEAHEYGQFGLPGLTTPTEAR